MRLLNVYFLFSKKTVFRLTLIVKCALKTTITIPISSIFKTIKWAFVFEATIAEADHEETMRAIAAYRLRVSGEWRTEKRRSLLPATTVAFLP